MTSTTGTRTKSKDLEQAENSPAPFIIEKNIVNNVVQKNKVV